MQFVHQLQLFNYDDNNENNNGKYSYTTGDDADKKM